MSARAAPSASENSISISSYSGSRRAAVMLSRSAPPTRRCQRRTGLGVPPAAYRRPCRRCGRPRLGSRSAT